MKNLILLLSSILLGIGCEQATAPSTDTTSKSRAGNIAFSFDKVNAPATVKTLTATLSRDGFSTLTQTFNIATDTSATILFTDVAVGTWKVKVDAKDDSDKVLYTGEAEVIVLESTVSQVNLTLSPVATGVGSVQINVTWGGVPGKIFPKTYGGSLQEVGMSAAQTNDDGYVIGGLTLSYGTDGDAWVVRTDVKGEVIWSKNYGGLGLDRINNIVQTSNNGFMFIGYKYGVGKDDSWVVKLDSIGNVEWSKDFGVSGDNALLILKQLNDGNYLACGYALDNGNYNGRILKFSPTGDLIWSKIYGGEGADFAMNFEELPNNNILVSGYNGSDFNKIYDFWVLKLNSMGELLWEKKYGDTNEERSAGLVQTSDGNFLLSGYKMIDGYQYGTIMKIDTAGNLLWNKLYGNYNEYLLKMVRTSDNSILVCGYNSVSGLGQQGLLMKINQSGDVIWNKNYGGTGKDIFSELHSTNDNNLIIVGTTNSSGNGSDDFWLLKVNTNGIVE